MYYTTDGSAPDPDDPEINVFTDYDPAFQISETTTIRMIARRTSWGDSEEVSGTFVIAPLVDVIIPGNLPLSVDYTTVELTEEVQERWYAVRITQAGMYFMNFADSESGEEEDTVNAQIWLYESDGETLARESVSDEVVNAANYIYSGAHDIQLAPGDYLLKVRAYYGSTGSCRVRIY